MPSPLKTKRPARPPLRLVWAEAATVTANPRNWRTHPEPQRRAVRAMLDDPAVGWAGALLYNEKTGRLIDGHCRLEGAAPGDLVPLLVGEWSEDAERQILARLDASGMLAGVDGAALSSLLDEIGPGGEDFAELDGLLAGLLESPGDQAERSAGAGGGESPAEPPGVAVGRSTTSSPPATARPTSSAPTTC